MQIGNSLRGIDHRQIRASGKGSIDSGLDFHFLRIAFQALVQVAQAVVRINPEFLEQVGILREHVLEEHAHKSTEQHRVRNLHHGRLQVHREQQALRLGLGHRLRDKLFERCHAEHRRIEDFALQERLCGTEFSNGASSIHEFNLERVGIGKRDGLLVPVKVIGIHARNAGLHGSIPRAVTVRVVAGKVLHRIRGATVGVALTEHRVHCGTLHLVVAGTDSLLLVGRRSIWIIRERIAVLLEFGDGGLELRHGS